MPGDHSECAPPDPISNSEVKRISADDSVRSPHAKVGHRQGFIPRRGLLHTTSLFFLLFILLFYSSLLFLKSITHHHAQGIVALRGRSGLGPTNIAGYTQAI